MKLSDYVAKFLADQGIRHVFAISGGASVHLIDSIEKEENIEFICPQHEQAGAMAADAYSRITGNLGAAVSTSGPGATNMITGIGCAYYDSVPVIFITGQVTTFRLKRDSGVRQMGFQETDVVDMCKPITKYANRLDDATDIRYELEKACYLAKSGRPGPVVLDIPDNLQREDIDPNQLRAFTLVNEEKSFSNLDDVVEKCIHYINDAQRPVLIVGWGIHLSSAADSARVLIELLGIPVLPTWAMGDLLPADHHLVVGAFGTHGTRYGNFAVQNADLVISIGARIDTRAAGSPRTTFARAAKKVIVDIDINELNKFEALGLKVDLLIHADAKEFIRLMNQKADQVEKQDISAWLDQISKWKDRFPICLPEYYQEEEVNPYVFVKELSENAVEGDVIFVDTGCALAWMMQAFEYKANQRMFHDFNNTAMGYALPASIGASLALDNANVICVTGDGSLQMNIQELATVIRHQLPIKIFLINNHGYSMIRQTQDQWLESKYNASSVDGGLAFPNLINVAQAYGFETVNIEKNSEITEGIKKSLDSNGPIFCNVEISSEHRVIPQTKFGRPIEDGEPLLSRDVFFENMIVDPLATSMQEE